MPLAMGWLMTVIPLIVGIFRLTGMHRLITVIQLVVETFQYVLVDDSHTLWLTRFGMCCLTNFNASVDHFHSVGY